MSRITKCICKALSVFLSLALLVQFLYLQGLPTLADAAKTPESTTASSPEDDLTLDDTVEVLGEDVSRREENIKHFVLSNHTSRAVVYAEPVHYEVDGEWQEIDNSLSSETALDGEDFNGFVNLANSFRVKFANNTNSSKLVRLRKDNYEIAWGYDGNAVSGNVKAKSKKQVTTLDDTLSVPMENAIGQIEYPYVEDNASLQYIVSGSGVKENIVVHSAADSYAYTFAFKVKNVTLSLQEDGSVVATATDTGETVFTIPAPFMTDANHRYSDAVSYSLTQKGNKKYTLTVTADAEWINSAETAFPVVIDPGITTEQDKSKITSTFVSSEYPSTALATQFSLRAVGRDGVQFGKTKSLFKFTLPTLNKGDMVIDAQLGLRMWNSSITPGVDTEIDAHIITSSWTTANAKWNSQPTVESVACDYNFITDLVTYVEWKYFDVTRAVKGWYEGTMANNGIMIQPKNPDAYATCWFGGEYYTAAEDDSEKYPFVYITYRNNKGLEDYWSYTGLSVGSAGTAYVNDYSGNLVFIAPLLTSPSERMPLSLSAVYNGYNSYDIYAVGKSSHQTAVSRGWRLNIQQTLLSSTKFGLKTSSNADYPLATAAQFPYVYTDGDGTDHYFKKVTENGTTTYVDEDGLDLTLTVSGSTYTITDKKDNKLKFNSAGNLTEMSDANGNKISIFYQSAGTAAAKNNIDDVKAGQKIDYVTDATGHRYDFTYGIHNSSTGATNNYVEAILDNKGRGVRFSRVNGSLTRITYTDGIVSNFTYDAMANHSSMLTAEDHDGYRLSFTYNALAKGKQVSDVQEYSAPDASGARLTGQKLTFDRSKYNQTAIRTAGSDGVFGNGNDLITYCQFDNLGRLTSSQVRNANNGNTGAAVTRYTEATTIKQINRVESSAAFGKNVTNFAKNGDAESGITNWTPTYVTATATATASTAQAYFGQKSIALQNSAISAAAGRTYVAQTISGLGAGLTYTFSAYVKMVGVSTKYTDDWTGAYIAVKPSTAGFTDSARITSTNTAINDGWHRLTVSVTLPTGCTSATVYLIFRNMTGTAYFDGIQFERNTAVHPFNLLQNASLEGTSNWTASPSGAGSAVTNERKESSYSLKIVGDAETAKKFSQTIPVAANPDDTYILSGWAKADAANLTNHENAKFELGISVKYKRANGTTFDDPKPAARFNTTLPMSNDWQYAAQPFSLRSQKEPTATPVSITVTVDYSYQINTAYFDFLQLIREPVPTYTYDDKGNLVNTVANSEQKSSIEYTGVDPSRVTDAAGYAYTYTHDDKHNLLTATSDGGVKTAFTYNTYGMATSSVVKNSEESLAIKSEIGYTENGKHTTYTKDADGRQTSYTYDSYDRLSSVTDPKGTTTSYTYVSNFDNRVASVEVEDTGYGVYYDYDGARLDALYFGDDTFTFEVDRFGNTLSTTVNDLALSTNTYAPNNGPLQQVTYANGGVRTYSYNWLGQLSAIGNGNATQYSWQYDDNGSLLGTTDHVADRKYTYLRDSLNRLVRQQIATTSGTALGMTEYDYDIRNNLTRYVLNMGGLTATQQYLYSAVSEQEETARYAKDNLPTRYLIFSGRYTDYDYDSLNRLTRRAFTTNTPYVNNYSYVDSVRGTVDGTTYTTSKLHIEIVDDIAYRYTYDGVGNIIRIEKGARVGETDTASGFTNYYFYEYDSLGQLTRVDSVPENRSICYTYDSCGNIASKTVYAYSFGPTESLTYHEIPLFATHYVYASLSEGFSSVLSGYTTYTYDANGVATETESKTFFYDEIGNPLDYGNIELWWEDGRRLSAILNEHEGLNVFYTYGSDGLRTSKTVNGVKHEYLYEGDKVVYEKRGEDQFFYYYDSYGHFAAIRHICAADNTDYIYYANTNAQGDVIGLYNGPGTQIVSYEYDAWGNVISMVDLTNFGLGTLNPIRYRGYYYDEETNWYYLQSRYYDPEIGRFINADGFVSTGQGVLGNNMYAYCQNNPIIYSDSSGNCIDVVFALIFWVWNCIEEVLEQITNNVPEPPSKASDELVQFIADYETFSPTPVDDGYGNLSIGYGHDIYPGENYSYLTQREALQLLANDLQMFERMVSEYSATIGVCWDQYQYDAFVSLAYNSGNYFKDVMDAIVAGENPYTAFEMIIYVYNSHTDTMDKSLGLYRRRRDEADIFVYHQYTREYPYWG